MDLDEVELTYVAGRIELVCIACGQQLERYDGAPVLEAVVRDCEQTDHDC